MIIDEIEQIHNEIKLVDMFISKLSSMDKDIIIDKHINSFELTFISNKYSYSI